jgi:Signal transduction histidine kinase
MSLARQLSIAGTYKDLGRFPPEWIPVQQSLLAVLRPPGTEEIALRFWTERLMVYADPLIRDVLNHIVDNSLRHGKTTRNMVVTWQRSGDGLDIIFRDDGTGIPADFKEKIFEYDAGHSGLGLFICRQILAVTGMTIIENGKEGEGARFVIHVPDGNYSIEGAGDDGPELPKNPDLKMPGPGAVPHSSGTLVKELASAEFPLAETIWTDYHHTTGNPSSDRIFGAFSGSELVSVARCKRHPDGSEVDGVFTPDRFRGKGYANAAVWGLVEACGGDTLYMHSVANLTGFYGHFGFVPIPEQELPDTIRERYAWAQGEMAGANVCPMRRDKNPW